MQVVVAAYSLAGAGGSETYAVTVADHLQRLGHDVWLYTPEPGRSTDAARRLGLRVAAGEHELPGAPEALLVQDGVVACDLAAHYPTTPQVFVAHSDIFDLQLPPQLPDLVAAVIVLYDRVDQRIRALAEPVAEVVRLSQPVDIERFKPTQPLHAQPRVAMTLSNYVHGQRLALLERACDRAGIELRHVGQYGEGERPADQVLNDADIVFGKARVIFEAMACGRAAYVFDHNGGDGWVTGETYAQLAPDNFGGQSLPGAIDEDRLVADLALYTPTMGIVNRDLIVSHHSAAKHAAALAAVLGRVALTPRSAPVEAPLRELARLVRLYHRADTQAFALRAETEALGARTQHAEQRVAELHEQARASKLEAEARAAALEAHAGALAARAEELDAALAHARAETAAQVAEAERLARVVRGVTETRRWRTIQAMLAPADRLRRAMSRTRPDQPPPSHPPAPFVVGVARSGTTLLRMQLDSHPRLAIGPETGFGLVVSRLALDGAGPKELLDAVVELDTWADLGLDHEAARSALEDVRPWSPGGGLRALYAAFAAAEGKPRWGDKTPLHVDCMPALAAALPEAHFIHVIRDGRDVAASVRDLPFAPGDGSIEAIACDWRDRIGAAREAAPGLAHYREVRYEQLVTEPEAVLRELCGFIELEFDTAMLRAHERAADRLAQLPEIRREGSGTATRAERIARHAHLRYPPDPARAGRWREALTADEVARFEACAGDLLAELGY